MEIGNFSRAHSRRTKPYSYSKMAGYSSPVHIQGEHMGETLPTSQLKTWGSQPRLLHNHQLVSQLKLTNIPPLHTCNFC